MRSACSGCDDRELPAALPRHYAQAINSGSGSQNGYARGAPIAAIQEPTKPDWVRVTSGVAKVSKRDTGFRASAFDFFATLEARFRRNSRLAPGSIRPFGPATQP
jgi:hypothetical protein